MLAMGSARVWSQRSSAWAAAGLLVVLAATTWWMLARGTRGAEIANVLALPISVAGLGAALFGISLRPPVSDHGVLLLAARDLAGAVARHEAAIQQRLLSDTGDARPANVGYAQLEAALVRWRSDGGGESGSLNTIAGFYRELQRGRLVVLGDPGAGKTVLAIRGLLDLIGALPEEDPKPGVRLRVPVRLSLPDLDLGDGLDPTALSRRLDAWIGAHLVSVYGVRAPVARALVEQGWILPVLDGLDEMDPDNQPPVRARAAVRALNQPTGTGLRPVLLTSREHRYRQLADQPDGPEVVQDATAVRIQPLSVEQVAAWLTYRFPDPTKPPGVEHRWLRVLRQLDVDRTGPLATCLTSPLRLYLTVTAYHDPASNPDELLTIPADQLDEHLFARLIPATVQNHPRPGGGHYDVDQVTHWLRTLAEHLSWMGAHGGSPVDLNLYDLWRTADLPAPDPGRHARSRAVRRYAGLSTALFVMTGALFAYHTGAFLPYDAVTWVGLVIGLLAIPAYWVLIHASYQDPPAPGSPAHQRSVRAQRLDFHRFRSATTRRVIATSLLGWSVGGILVVGLGVLLIRPSASGTGIAIGVAYGVTYALAVNSAAAPTAIDRPSRLVGQNLRYELVVVLLPAIAVELVDDVGRGLSAGTGLAVAMLMGLFLRAGAPWPLYLVATRMLARQGRLPARPARFLDWAYSAGLMRLSGIAVQFRHVELRHRLTRDAQPLAADSTSGSVR